MTNSIQLAMLCVGSYLVGTVPFGLIIARLNGVNIRAFGSGNAGATNVGRAMGRPWGILVFLLDAGKGAASMIVARWVMDHVAVSDVTQRDLIWLGAGFACILGNIAPFYLRFRGGKGVATSLGAIMGIFPFLTLPGIFVMAVWIVTVKTTRYVSLASIAAALSLTPLFLSIAWLKDWPIAAHWPLLTLSVVLAFFIAIRHRSNLARIRAGTENKIGSSAATTEK